MVGEPPGDRAASAADLQTAGVARELELLDAALGQRIEPLLEQS
jgi:hypothetical protein